MTRDTPFLCLFRLTAQNVRVPYVGEHEDDVLCSLRPRPKLFITRRAKTNVTTSRRIAITAVETALITYTTASHCMMPPTERSKRLPDVHERIRGTEAQYFDELRTG